MTLGALAAALSIPSAAHAQGAASEHEAHHPGATATADAPSAARVPAPAADAMRDDAMASMPAPLPDRASDNGSVAASTAGAGDCCGSADGPPLYPSLMSLQALTPLQRTALEQRARAQVTEGTGRLQQAHQRLGQAVTAGQLHQAQQALPELRGALGWLEGGLAAYAMLAHDAPPQSVALDWFRRELGVAEPAGGAPPHGLFGLSWFHYLAMAALAALATGLVWVWRQRARRTRTLLAQLTEPAAAHTPALARAPLAASPTAAAAPAAAAVPAGAAAPVPAEIAPSAPNAWSGVLRVAQVFQETEQVKTFRLVDPGGGKLPFTFLPGQFLTLTVAPEDQAVRRSYTIASSPTRRDYCEITVRGETQGVVSRYLHDRVHRGELLQVRAPAGRFTFTGEEAGSIVLVAGGVGITPMMSVVRYLTDRCWPGRIDLVFGCKADNDAIFREELEYLARRFPNLHLTLVAGQTNGARWPHRTGRITEALLREAVPQIAARRIHLCGPPPMMEAVKQMLAMLGVPAEQVRTEAFIGQERPVAPVTPAAPGASVAAQATAAAVPAAAAGVGAALPASAGSVATATFARSGKRAALPPDRTILEAAEDVGVEIDYACRSGTCGTCRVRLLAGSVTMQVQDGLEPTDRANGIVLACQAKSSADVTVDA